MYYRILEEDLNSYSPFGYNENSRENFKKDVEHLLMESLSFNDVTEVSKLKFDQYRAKLRSYGLIIEESSVPFESIDSIGWSFDDDDDMFGEYSEDY